MKVYVLEVPGLEKVKQNKIDISGGIDVQYVPINNKEKDSFRNNFNKKWHFEQYGFELSDPEYLNCLTHRSAWKLFLESKEEWCCIVEENVKVDLEISEVNHTINQLEKNWDVFFPFNKFNDNCTRQIAEMSNKLVNPNIREMVDIQPFYLGFLWGNNLYFLSKKGANLLYSTNEIKQRVDDEIFFLTEHSNLETYYDDFPWFNPKDQEPFLPIERYNNIYNAVLNYNIWKPESLFLARRILSELSFAADKLQIDLLLQGGSHLGYIRHGGIMPWDDDIDIGIEACNLQRFLNEIRFSTNLMIGSFIENRTNTQYYKIWDKKGYEIEGYEYTFPFIDFWLYTKEGNDIIFNNGIICPNSNSEQFLEVDFEGSNFKIPNNSIECLDTRYIDWKTVIRIYLWSHQQEQGTQQPLTTNILVNKNGRIIRNENSPQQAGVNSTTQS